MKKLLTICLISFIVILTGNAQDITNTSLQEIQSLLNEDHLNDASDLLSAKTTSFTQAQQYDSLALYSYLIGKIAILENDKAYGIKKIEDLTQTLIDKCSSPISLYHAYSNLGIIYSENGEMPLAYENIEKSKEYLVKTSSENLHLDTEYYLAEFSMKMGDFNLFDNHIRTATKMIEKADDQELQMTAKVYNLMGGLMFFSSKSDSAYIFFDKALDNIKNLEQSPKNKYYLPAAIKGNVVMLKQNEGKFEEAIALEKESNQLNHQFIQQYPNHPLATNVKRNISIGYLGLASLYNDLGDYDNAEKFSKLLYHFSKENFESNTQEYFTALLNHAEIKLFKKEFTKAQSLLIEAEKCLNSVPGENLQLHAHLNGVFGNLYFQLDNHDLAKDKFLLSKNFYEKAHSGVYSRDRLYQLMNLASILSGMDDNELAIKLAFEAYDNYSNNDDANDQLILACMQTLSKVYYDAGEYDQSILWSEKALGKYQAKVGLNGTQDVAIFDILKADIYLLHAQAKYAQIENKNEAILHEIIQEVNLAVQVFENRNSLVSSVADVNISLENDKKIFEFLKSLYIELYQLSNDPADLHKLISLHESGLYNRIRVRLNIRDNIVFKGVPEAILQREKELRKNMNTYIANPETSGEEMKLLLETNEKWIDFLDSLKINQPKYYMMRYGSIEKPLDNLQSQIPENTTVIRYMFIDEKLFVFVCNNTNEWLTPLSYQGLLQDINSYTNFDYSNDDFGVYHDLYSRLWSPIAKLITTDKVIIIPDGPLFNVSFESLTDKPIKHPKEFINHSLLGQFCFSYNYSLFLLDQKKNGKPFNKNFIAFAPEFTDQMKEEYKYSITDSLNIDKTYLNLLPQPFSSDLVNTFSQQFDGEAYTNSRSTETVFKKHANEHKIIHIGTHAESNNLSPELSRLIFAKNISDTTTTDDNSLYTYEIYDCNLACDLAILTACETGKPSFQPGEGMISLAHAFNYAGSESILTSLWKIDESASSKIIEYFYDNISAGMSKDKALQQAKLQFLSNAEGRLYRPQYWAGMVLIGDATAIEIESNNRKNNWLYWVIALLGIVSVLYLIYRKRRAA